MKTRGPLYTEVLGEDDMRFGGIEAEHNTFSRNKAIIYNHFDKNGLEDLLKDFPHHIIESRKQKGFDRKSYARRTTYAIAKKYDTTQNKKKKQ